MTLGFILFDPVAFLQTACELLTAPIDGVQVVIGQFTPLFLDLAFELRPLALDDVFVHDVASCFLVGMSSLVEEDGYEVDEYRRQGNPSKEIRLGGVHQRGQ